MLAEVHDLGRRIVVANGGGAPEGLVERAAEHCGIARFDPPDPAAHRAELLDRPLDLRVVLRRARHGRRLAVDERAGHQVDRFGVVQFVHLHRQTSSDAVGFPRWSESARRPRAIRDRTVPGGTSRTDEISS